MIELDRLCIPIGDVCNLNCIYCCRHHYPTTVLFQISDDLYNYIRSNNYKTIVLTGGEPLLYLDRLKYIFSLCPSNVHKKVVTNGTLINKSFVKYANMNNIEITISHDGINTELLRTVDIFKISEILNNVRNINNLTICSTITNKNSNIINNYLYIKKYLKDTAFAYMISPAILPDDHALIDGFNYIEYTNSLLEYYQSYKRYMYFYNGKLEKLNVTMNGVVTSNLRQIPYGTIYDDITTILTNKYQSIDVVNKCLNNDNCKYKHYCFVDESVATEFACRLHDIDIEIQTQLGCQPNNIYGSSDDVKIIALSNR